MVLKRKLWVTLLALTTHTPLQPLYLTYEGPPKPEHAYYDLTTFELHTNPCSLYDAYSLMLREKTNLKIDQEQFIRSNAPTAGPLISVRPAEALLFEKAYLCDLFEPRGNCRLGFPSSWIIEKP